MSFFVQSLIGDQRVQNMLDCLIILLNPEEKNRAHVTLRGPYVESPSALLLLKSIGSFDVSVLGVGIFNNPKKAAVYLKCDSPVIQKIWWKPSFNQVNPHLTILETEDRDYAERVRVELSAHRTFFMLPLSEPRVIQSSRGQSDLILSLNANFESLGSIVGRRMTLEELKNLSIAARVMYLHRICNLLLGYCRKQYAYH